MTTPSPLWNALDTLSSSSPDELVARVVSALRQGSDPNGRNDLGQTPLHHCCRAGRHEPIGALVGGGADVLAVDVDGFTPAMEAVNMDYGDCLRALAAAGDDLHKHLPQNHPTLLHGALANASAEAAIFLLDQGFDPLLANKESGLCPVHMSYKLPEVLEHMARHGVNLDVANVKNGDTVAHRVASFSVDDKHASSQTLSRSWAVLLEAGTNLRQLNHQGESARALALREKSCLRDMTLAWEARQAAQDSLKSLPAPHQA